MCLKEIIIQLQLNNERNIRKVKGYSIFKDIFGKIKLCLILEFIEGEDLNSFLKVKFLFFFLNYLLIKKEKRYFNSKN
jgi:hypothetical protein